MSRNFKGTFNIFVLSSSIRRLDPVRDDYISKAAGDLSFVSLTQPDSCTGISYVYIMYLCIVPIATAIPVYVFLAVWTVQVSSLMGEHGSTTFLVGTTVTQSSSDQYTSTHNPLWEVKIECS